jgi:hypothetical protein
MLSRRNLGQGFRSRLGSRAPAVPTCTQQQRRPAQIRLESASSCAAIGPQVGTDLVLFEAAYVRSNVRDFRAGQLHVRHLRVWIEEKEGNLCRVKVGALRYAGKWRRLRRRFLTWCNHMAFGAPALDHGFSMVWINSKC